MAALDELADASEADSEDAGGLVCGEVAGPDHLRLHDPMMRQGVTLWEPPQEPISGVI
ncbi:hypothetical protein [Streptomyces paradoxus]|uniref:hypothetical protein n=1 Tax=Streptomyces paradoxus TaxID=66375 RepID=UPI0037F26DD4